MHAQTNPSSNYSGFRILAIPSLVVFPSLASIVHPDDTLSVGNGEGLVNHLDAGGGLLRDLDEMWTAVDHHKKLPSKWRIYRVDRHTQHLLPVKHKIKKYDYLGFNRKSLTIQKAELISRGLSDFQKESEKRILFFFFFFFFFLR
ncbi:hypothetical protein ACH5RR_030943 [Cinchona calisaya]|uniref:Uncharacterized protein n=1 Tax=Cinchona calisaya TaxID=153742 RepID=A0ABD2YF23_9GENT